MKLKQWFFLLLAAILLLTSAGCKGPYGAGSEGESVVYPSLTDEEYYSEPELIVQATVDVVKKQYTTDPTESTTGKTAEVTVYNIFISNVYRGRLGDEPPSVFHVKIYNTEEEPFYLTVGKKYILGLNYVKEADDEYGDGGGYVIIGPRRWTIQQAPNSSEYRNFAQTTDVRSWESLLVLLEKIAEQQELPEPNPQPVPQPKYTVDGIKKDPAITDAQREQFYELYRTWRVDAMTEFSPEKPMQLELFKYYCAYFVTDEEKTYVDMGVNYTGAAVERIAKRFGTTYGLKEDEAVFVKAGSLLSIPFAELIWYKEEKVDGKTLVTARCINYSFDDYQYSDQAHIEASETYSARKEMIIKGKVTGYDYFTIDDFSFYTEDGKTPTQFVSFARYYPESIADGYQTLPEFVPAKQTESKPAPEEDTKEPAEKTEPEEEEIGVLFDDGKYAAGTPLSLEGLPLYDGFIPEYHYYYHLSEILESYYLGHTIVFRGVKEGLSTPIKEHEHLQDIYTPSYCETQLRVTEVFYGDVQVGDLITHWEDIRVVKSEGQTKLATAYNVPPIAENEEYIFILSKWDGKISSTGTELYSTISHHHSYHKLSDYENYKAKVQNGTATGREEFGYEVMDYYLNQPQTKLDLRREALKYVKSIPEDATQEEILKVLPKDKKELFDRMIKQYGTITKTT